MITENERFEKKHGTWGTVMHDQTILNQFEKDWGENDDE